MGKMTILGLLTIIVILTLVMASVFSNSRKLPEAVTDQIVHSQVKYISNYALTYAIQKLIDQTYTITPGVTETYNSNTDSPFNVLNGTVNTIILDVSAAKDTIEIFANVSCIIQGQQVNHIGRAFIAYSPVYCTPQGVDNAITTSGKIDLKGNATVNGNIEEQATLDFEDIFGITKEEMRNGAHNLYVDPPNSFQPVNNITWVEYEDNTTTKITQNNWVGSGILVIDGDITITGGHFYGIIWITGNCKMTVGNPFLQGAMFIEGPDPDDVMKIGGTVVISYDSTAVNQSLELLVPGADVFDIMSWYE